MIGIADEISVQIIHLHICITDRAAMFIHIPVGSLLNSYHCLRKNFFSVYTCKLKMCLELFSQTCHICKKVVTCNLYIILFLWFPIRHYLNFITSLMYFIHIVPMPILLSCCINKSSGEWFKLKLSYNILILWVSKNSDYIVLPESILCY